MDKCFTSYVNIGKFISNINGNWRNCIYITCSVCKFNKQSCCDDMLMSFDADGKPVFITVRDANCIFSTIIDKSECMFEMSSGRCGCLFENMIKKHTSKDECPFLQFAKYHTHNTDKT